tara:strand:+ start:183 stop:710 length:528 start_codon:yes stop_codon:yes gene_type:complete
MSHQMMHVYFFIRYLSNISKTNLKHTLIMTNIQHLISGAICVFALLFLISCAAQETTHGNQIDAIDIDKIQIGSTRKSELKIILGPPSFEGSFASKKIYYSNVKRQSPLGRKAVINSSDLYAFEFDDNDILLDMTKITELPNSVNYESEKTTAPGVQLGILEQIFFNLRRRQNTE